jgi:CBS domain-containing protein
VTGDSSYTIDQRAEADRAPATHTRRTVADAMLNFPKTCPSTTTVDEARTMLLNDHVHALLVVENGQLSAIVERADLTCAPGAAPARQSGKLVGRIVGPDVDLDTTWQWMRVDRHRRLAVVDDTGRLLGLLCLKRSGRGFCSDAGVLDRARERRHTAMRPGVDAGSPHR